MLFQGRKEEPIFAWSFGGYRGHIICRRPAKYESLVGVWYWIISQEMNRKVFRDINMLTQLHQYEPPKWASSLKNIPQHFVKVRYLNALSIALEVSFLKHEFWIYRI